MSNPAFIPAEDTIILGCVDEATAYVVDDYPYGRLRTQIRYWIESVQGRGDRFVSQTKNPKTGAWNKPKKSTYSPIKVMYLEAQPDERLFVKTAGLGLWNSTEDAEAFIKLIGADLLNTVQKRELAKIIGMNKVMQHVTFSVHEGEYTEEDKQRGLETQARVNRAMAGASAQALKEIG